MRPILYSGDETRFTSEGLGRLADCTRCIVTEERNGIYLCEFDYPVTGAMYDLLLEGGIVGVIHDDNHDIQPFDIYAHTAPLNGIVTFYARHISYRLSNVILRPMAAQSCAEALAAFETQTYNHNPFTFWTDKSVTGTWTNDVPASVKSRLAGQQGSILDVYGKGEYKYDKWTVRLYVNRGADNGVSIRYGVNLTGLTEELDGSEVYSDVAPFWRSSDGDIVVTLPEGYVVAGSLPIKIYPWTTELGEIITTEDGTPIEFETTQVIPVPMDLSDQFSEQPTVAQLRAAATTRLNNSEAWLPDQNITINFVDLAHTEDYKDVDALQRVSLCDRVSVYCGPLGVSAAKVQVVRVVYNVLTEQYDEIELGKIRPTYAETVLKGVEQLVQDMPTKAMMEEAIQNATQLITGAKDSHVTFVYDANGGLQEILVMDTDNINTARKIWRWNLGGLGHSSNGYAGPYSTAITQDGSIVADFITTGSLNAGIIKAGTLSADRIGANSIAVSKLTGTISGGLSSSWQIDLTNGTMTIGNISAANITTGTLNADRIGANSISVSKLSGTINGGLSNSWVIDLDAGTLTIGNISAANITTGTMSADRIFGGTISGNNVSVTNLSASNITTGTLSADRIAADSISVAKLTGTISGGLGNSWQIDLENGTLTVGNISAADITTGTLSAARIGANSISVGKLTGTITGGLSSTWEINLTNGTLTIGDISADNIITGTMSADRLYGGTISGNNVAITNLSASNITSGTLSADRIGANSISVGKLTGTITGGLLNTWQIDLEAGTLTIGNISADNITTGTLSADRISGGTINGNNVAVTNLNSAALVSGPIQTSGNDCTIGAYGTININGDIVTNGYTAKSATIIIDGVTYNFQNGILVENVE